MSRAAAAVVVTLLGLMALATFKSSPGVPAKTAATPDVKSPVPASTAPPPGTSPATDAPATDAPTTPPTTNAGATRTLDGDPFDNRFGTVQVRVTLQGNRITDVTPLQMPFDRERSAEISRQAQPLILQEVLQAQSAQIDIIGGATYTTESYAQSLQSALDQAGH
jgi:uncharacterized protein with FMN-binding domain